MSESIDVKETVEVGSTTHEKRGMRPSPKSIENRMELDSGTLERYWDKVMTIVSEHRESYPHDSVNQIRAATREIRAQFHQYQMRWLSYMDFLALANTSECQGEREAMDKVMNNRSRYLQTVLAEFEEHKKELLLELDSRRSSSRASSVSSAAVRAQLLAEAAAALKRVEMQKKRSIAEAQSTLLIQQEEMALARKRKEERDCMEEEILQWRR